VNPAQGFAVGTNNDPGGVTFDNDPLDEMRPGGGILYISGVFAPGVRSRRITDLVERQISAGVPFTADDLKRIQADVVLGDAVVLAPVILRAFDNAAQAPAGSPLAALAADPGVQQAVRRIRTWDFSTPTGIPEGFDGSEKNGVRVPPSQAEIQSSIAATIYSVWRNRIIENTLVRTLTNLGLPILANRAEPMTAVRNLFDRFDVAQGIGASGVDFFARPGIADPAVRRDLVVLESLAQSLDLLAGDAFAAAFGRSRRQDDYRWGRLHRVVFMHPLGPPFSTPPAGGAFPPPLPDLDGIPLDGGLFTVDAGTHFLRLNNSEGFRPGIAPIQRYVGQVVTGPLRISGETSLAGGQSGVLGSPFNVNLLPDWLTNETFPLRNGPGEPLGNEVVEQIQVKPAR
jgi:penicillin G amidase